MSPISKRSTRWRANSFCPRLYMSRKSDVARLVRIANKLESPDLIEKLPVREANAMRNVIVHDYEGVNLRVVAKTPPAGAWIETWNGWLSMVNPGSSTAFARRPRTRLTSRSAPQKKQAGRIILKLLATADRAILKNALHDRVARSLSTAIVGLMVGGKVLELSRANGRHVEFQEMISGNRLSPAFSFLERNVTDLRLLKGRMGVAEATAGRCRRRRPRKPERGGAAARMAVRPLSGCLQLSL